MIRLALLRHGHTAWNREGRIQGRSDQPLDAEARAQLAGLALPPPWDSAALWSSPLSRASETARLVAGREPRISDALSELDWGDWEGQRGADLRADPASGYRDIAAWGPAFRPPGGESLPELWSRLSRFLAGLDRNAVLVSHIGVMRALLARAHGWGFLGPPPFAIKRNRLYLLSLDGDSLVAEAAPVRLVPRSGAGK